MSVDQETVHQTMRERGTVYGEPHHSHKNIGLEWTGILQQFYGIDLPSAIPAHVVELMMASFKIHRAVRVFHEDNYVDCRAYLEFAEHGHEHPNEPFVRHKIQ